MHRRRLPTVNSGFGKQFIILCFLLFCSSTNSKSTRNSIVNREGELIESCLENYNKLVRPVQKYSDQLKARINFQLTRILSINEKSQLIKTNILLRISWVDLNFVWDPQNYDNITNIRIPITKIWYPDLMVYNPGDDYANIFEESTPMSFVYFNGTTFISSPILLTSSCLIDVTWFPFDEQKCTIMFGSWTYSGCEMDLDADGPVHLKKYLENGEWELKDTSIKRTSLYYAANPGVPYFILHLTLRIKRKILYYFFSLIVPSALIGFLAVLGFTLPPDSGEKLTLGVTLLFSLIMFSNNISNSMPSNADSIPLLGTYFTCIMVTIASSVVSTIIINLNVNTIGTPKEINGWKSKLLLEWIPTFLRMNPTTTLNEPNLRTMKNQLGSLEKEMNSENSQIYNATQRIRHQWKIVALVVDRICLIFSLTFSCVASTVLLINCYSI